MWAVPLKLTAISIGDTLWESPLIELDSKQVQLFQDELSRIEQEKWSSTEWSQMFLHSMENKFLFEILRPRKGSSFENWRLKYPEFLEEALHRSPKALEFAAYEWKAFADKMFADHGVFCPRLAPVCGNTRST